MCPINWGFAVICFDHFVGAELDGGEVGLEFVVSRPICGAATCPLPLFCHGPHEAGDDSIGG